MTFTVTAHPFPVTWDLDQNVAHMEEALADSNLGELVAFPEGALSGYSDDLAGLSALSLARLEPALQHLAALGRRRDVHIVVPTLWPGETGFTNSGVHLSPDGSRHWYHKVNLAHHERGVLQFGQALPVWTAGPVPLGIQLCRDLKFPEQWRWLAQRGASLVVYCAHAASDATQYPVWRSQLISRAAETQRFVLAVNTVHPESMCPTAIVDPRGHVLAESPAGVAQPITASLNLDEVSDWYLSQARTDLLYWAGPLAARGAGPSGHP